MDPFTRRLTAAHGYLELGLPEEALGELDEIAPPERRGEWPALALRVAILQELKRWAPMAEAARRLVVLQPEEAQWLVVLAYATRRAESIAAARVILTRARILFPEETTIPYNLACYAAQTGELESARTLLRRALAMEPAWREKAALDPDLAPLWPELDELCDPPRDG